MKLTRAEFLQIVAGGSAWLVSSGFTQSIWRRDAARPLPLSGAPHRRAAEERAGPEREYLLALEPDRMLAFYRTRAGSSRRRGLYGLGCRRPPTHRTHRRPLPVGRQPDVAATGDARFKQRADYIVAR